MFFLCFCLIFRLKMNLPWRSLELSHQLKLRHQQCVELSHHLKLRKQQCLIFFHHAAWCWDHGYLVCIAIFFQCPSVHYSYSNDFTFWLLSLLGFSNRSFRTSNFSDAEDFNNSEPRQYIACFICDIRVGRYALIPCGHSFACGTCVREWFIENNNVCTQCGAEVCGWTKVYNQN